MSPLQTITGRRSNPDTPLAEVWLGMFIAGLGIGPSFSIFTIVVQSAVQQRMLGAATSALTFFRQVGGSIGLAITGTIFGTSFADQIPNRLSANGVPQPLIDGFSQNAGRLQGELTGVGVDLGDQILSSVPAPARPQIEPFIGAIVEAIHQAFSLAVANAMWIALGGALGAALIVTLVVPELALRRTTGAQRAEGSCGAVPAME